MTTRDSNPYAVPGSRIPSIFPREPSLLRGIVYALPLGMLGFVLMYASISVSTLYRERGSQYPQIYVLNRLPELCFWPSIVCSLIFALAAVLNFTPTAPIGMFRALIYTGGYAVIGFVTTFVATIAFDLAPRGYSLDPWEWARTAIAIGVLIFLIAIHTTKRCRRTEFH